MVKQKCVCHSSVTVLLLTFVLLSGGPGGVPSVRGDDDASLVFYMFEQFVADGTTNATNVIASAPDGDLGSLAWGDLAVTDMPVRATADPEDPVIGNSPALIFPQSSSALRFYVVKLITLSTELYNGTLFASSDLHWTTLTDLVSTQEFAVAGGTGSFRDVSGYITVTMVSAGDDFSIYKYEAYLYTCVRTRVRFI